MNRDGLADAAIASDALPGRHTLLGIKPSSHGAADGAASFSGSRRWISDRPLAHCVRSWRRDFFNQSRKPGSDRLGEQRQLIKFCLLLLLVTLPISLSASLCQFCLQPHAIAYQPYPWTGFRQYTWEDVSAVTATCRYSRGRYSGWRKQLVVEMHDGAGLDLMTWPTAAVRAYRSIAQALQGQDFAFDASGIAPGCPEPYLGLLTHRP
jgi:hypothetical protein